MPVLEIIETNYWPKLFGDMSGWQWSMFWWGITYLWFLMSIYHAIFAKYIFYSVIAMIYGLE